MPATFTHLPFLHRVALNSHSFTSVTHTHTYRHILHIPRGHQNHCKNQVMLIHVDKYLGCFVSGRVPPDGSQGLNLGLLSPRTQTLTEGHLRDSPVSEKLLLLYLSAQRWTHCAHTTGTCALVEGACHVQACLGAPTRHRPVLRPWWTG